ncbi:MAG: helix-turn-helix domain-containing protein [Acidobacteriota bacterium]
MVNVLGLENLRRAFETRQISQTHLDLYAYIDVEGTPVTEIARRKGVSKQAVSKLVREMVKIGCLEIVSDPNDARVKKVFFKTSGRFSITHGLESLQSIDEDLKGQMGEAAYERLLDSVSSLLPVLDALSQPAQSPEEEPTR